jgi:hypothetical protein
MLTTTQTLVHGTIGALEGGLSGNTVTEYQQLTAEWHLMTVRDVVSAALFTPGRSYTTTEGYFWPAVLGSIRHDPWPLRAGGTDSHIMPVYAREAYRGPCKAVVTEVWAATAPTPSVPGVMTALPIVISTPFCPISIQPTLHGAIDSFNVGSGTDHPVYDYAGATFSYAATVPTDWPATIIKSDEVRPFRGGWLRTTVTVYRPDGAVPV